MSKADLISSKKRPNIGGNEAYYTRKRDLLEGEKRPTKTEASGKGLHWRKCGLLYKEKRPATGEKETCTRGKRDPHQGEKRPMTYCTRK